MKYFSIFTFLVSLSALITSIAHSQTTKEINEQTQFWWSINSTKRVTENWGIIADFHIRRNDFVEDPSFYFIRFGSHFWLTDKFALSVGYAHMWQAPAHDDWHTWTDENRIYEQLQYSTKIGSASVLNRLRTEQRWKEEIEGDALTGENSFSNRLRYLLSFSIPVSKKPTVPLLVLSDEILVQFGKDIVANTFDQNRFFVGIKKSLSPAWAFDFGYMPIYQQLATGYQYDLNHTVRWFFYFTPNFSNIESVHEPASNEE
jgi:hypothetical protein